MNTYTVTLEQEVIVTRRHTIVVEANNDDEAEMNAYSAIGDDQNKMVDTDESPAPATLVKVEETPDAAKAVLASKCEPAHFEMLLDREVRDWHLSEMSETEWSGPADHRDNYRLTVEQSFKSGQLFFSLYPVALDKTKESTLNGLSGCIEIRNGRPALSIGLNPDDHPVHIESDVRQGLFLHYDSTCVPVKAQFHSFDHGMDFTGWHFDCAEDNWLEQARREIADAASVEYLKTADAADRDQGDWKVTGDEWSKFVACDDPRNVDWDMRNYSLQFYNNSTMVQAQALTQG